jgi:nicotinamide mononucleotide transporter
VFEKVDKLDLYWVAFLGITGLISSIYVGDSLFSASVLLSGILCVSLIAVGRIEGYIFSLYNSISYAWLAYNNGLFGETMLNLGFFLPTGILGIYLWKRKLKEDVVVMRSLKWPYRAMIVGVCVFLTLGLGKGLSMIEGQNSPYPDGTTNVLSIVATFLMLGRYMEQWFLYITLNIVTIAMWVIRWNAGGNSGDLMIIMWGLFLVNSLYGCWRWHKGAVDFQKDRSEIKKNRESMEVVVANNESFAAEA